jgi:hypothetical protein
LLYSLTGRDLDLERWYNPLYTPAAIDYHGIAARASGSDHHHAISRRMTGVPAGIAKSVPS